MLRSAYDRRMSRAFKGIVSRPQREALGRVVAYNHKHPPPGGGPYVRRLKAKRKDAAQESLERQAVADVHRLVDRARGLGETRWNPSGSY